MFLQIDMTLIFFRQKQLKEDQLLALCISPQHRLTTILLVETLKHFKAAWVD